MHNVDISLTELTKVEGSAALDVRVRENKVEYVHFKITEYKRFFTDAVKGKPVAGLPQLLARICGTCSNAHLLCSIEACEHALGVEPSEQTKLLRLLTMYGLMIRDHALHLYLFAMPDIFGKDSFLAFDEQNELEHQLLHDAFDLKAAGNYLATIIAGRSVHALYPAIGGYSRVPEQAEIDQVRQKLEAIRPAVLRLIEVFEKSSFHFDRKTHFLAMIPERFGFLNGIIRTSKGETFTEEQFRDHLEHAVLPYSQASAYRYKGEAYMVGALARMNLAKDRLHEKTKTSAASALARFPSTDIFDNNLAQAVEILHSVDDGLEILNSMKIAREPLPPVKFRAGEGIGVVEAPRGTLYHRVSVNEQGMVREGEVIVPTGQNQMNIEADIGRLVEELIPDTPQETIEFEIEKLIRAYDPCMSCASHFLKVNWAKA